MHHSTRLAVALAAASAVAGAAAAPITFRVNVATIAYDNSAGLLPFGSTGASTFQVNYTFESTTPDSPTFPGVGTYNGTLSGYEVIMNGITYTGQAIVTNVIQVADDYGNPGAGDYVDSYEVAAQDQVTGPGHDSHMLSIRLANAYNLNPVSTGIAGIALPLAPFDVSGFTDNTVTFALFTNINGQLRSFSLGGGVTSIEFATAAPPPPPPPPPSGGPNPMPEPGALTLFLTALGTLAAQRRAQRKVSTDRA